MKKVELVWTRFGHAPRTNLSGGATSAARRRGSYSSYVEEQGKLAYTYGVPVINNPFNRKDMRKLWNRGWHRARMAAQKGPTP